MTAYTENMTQAATYWPPSANDGFGGVSYGAATQILCRWQNAQKLFRDAQGQEVMSEAIVYVDRALQNKGKLKLGTHAGSAPSDALEIRSVQVSPSLDGTQELNKVML
ncbi:MAG: hypothetical protein KIT65_10965 [Xanthobacteraceae bacterium]|nr:hypothetical protein [Xanthobacteraceae bacterium]